MRRERIKPLSGLPITNLQSEEGKAWQDIVMPVRAARFAIDDHIPHSDLYLSPGNCIFFNEALIPVMYLINETSIAQATPSNCN
jgi:hypothetical protein